MKPLLHSSSSFFFSFTLLMIFFINIPTCLCQDDKQYTNCSTAFTCGNVPNLRYPFWGENRQGYCGGVSDPNTKLTCEESVPKITINNVKYRVIRWEDTTQKLTVARDDYSSGNVCAVNDDFKSGTFDNTLFQSYSTDIYNITLLYNCPVSTNLPDSFHSIPCDDTKSVVYYVGYVASSICTSTDVVVIPILGTFSAQLASGNGIEDALKEGFELKWNGNYTECQSCLATRGVCGNDGGNKFRCFCRDGAHTTSCNSQMASSM